MDQAKTALSEQVNKLTQENSECNNERAILQRKIDSITSNIDHSGAGLVGKIKTIIEEKNKCQEERSVLEKSNLDLQNEVSSLKDLLLQGTFPTLSDELSLFYSAHELV
ncbi:MAG: hypothetical protein sL5_10270 [Candidatus Mesenet longicola]|uniref:Uncharacterized protein n=1 Tax=Candidatus Mesenet longicola TaxID=1892558 RepID=A0A8J3MMK5_9RICK|nr:MAG: hypothetical protein sGL2_11060 [Candidatus Mesenet longicola]GHM60034.1 MAG: hypothetical protein sL5_10270 [Candidatus Mesenet longicola]